MSFSRSALLGVLAFVLLCCASRAAAASRGTPALVLVTHGVGMVGFLPDAQGNI